MGKIVENYSLQQQLGRGVFSTVFKAVNLVTQQEVAIKMVKFEKFRQYPKLEEGTYHEIQILGTLEPCKHIIRYYDMLKTVNNFYFVYEYCNGGTLEGLLKRSERLKESAAVNYLSQIVEAFKVLAKRNIMHRDLKPENILIHDGVLKLGDFGFCKPLENEFETTNTMLGSPIYMAPQILRGQTYTIKADVWSLGIVFYRMLFGVCPFESTNIVKLLNIIDHQDMRVPENSQVSPDAVFLLRRMINRNPTLRADWNEVFSFDLSNNEVKRPELNSRTLPSHSSEKGKEVSKEVMKNSIVSTDSTGLTKRKSDESQQPYSSRSFGRGNPVSRDRFDRKGALTPSRDNAKKDNLVNNHLKCIDINGLALTLAAFDSPDALELSCLLLRQVHTELLGIVALLHKENALLAENPLLKQFLFSVQGEVEEVKRVLAAFREEVRPESWNSLTERKRDVLKRFVNTLNRDKHEDLVNANRILDFVLNDILIRKETFEKLSKEKLLSNMRTKLERK